MSYTLHIKNMVCNRCIKVVNEELNKLGIYPISITLGLVSLSSPLSDKQYLQVTQSMTENGFEMLDNKKQQTIDKIKTYIIDQIHHQEKKLPSPQRFSELISQHLSYDYSYLSHLFSTQEGLTIEKYIITQKVERIKELLSYKQLSIKEIAHIMNYSSAQHLSNQFKTITGQSPTAYKQQTSYNRKALDDI